MEQWSIVNRPVTLDELSIAFGESKSRLERIVFRHRVSPVFRIGRVRLYGPAQVRAIYSRIQKSRLTKAASSVKEN